MEHSGENTKSVVKATSDNLNIIIEVQRNWKYVENCKMEIITTKDRALVLKIRNHLTDYLSQLESVEEVNLRLKDLKKNLTEEISKFHDYINDVLLKRKSLVMQSKTATVTSLLADINSDYLEGSGAHTVFVDSKEITSDMHDKPETQDHNHVKRDSTTQNKKKKSIVSRLTKVFQSFVTCGSTM